MFFVGLTLYKHIFTNFCHRKMLYTLFDRKLLIFFIFYALNISNPLTEIIKLNYLSDSKNWLDFLIIFAVLKNWYDGSPLRFIKIVVGLPVSLEKITRSYAFKWALVYTYWTKKINTKAGNFLFFFSNFDFKNFKKKISKKNLKFLGIFFFSRFRIYFFLFNMYVRVLIWKRGCKLSFLNLQGPLQRRL